MKIVDTHCHLELTEFDNDREQVVRTAADAGVFMISSATTPDTWQKCLDLSSAYQVVHSAIGLDPLSPGHMEQALIFASAHNSSIVAVGEVGLDHYETREPNARALQEVVFRGFINLAREMALPLQVHSRSAGKAALSILDNESAADVHMHAFDGKASLARTASKDHGYYFSIPTSVVRSPQKRKLVKAVDMEHMLVETDSPALGPYRNQRNEPSNVFTAVDEICRILDREKEEMLGLLLENTRRLYRGLRRERSGH